MFDRSKSFLKGAFTYLWLLKVRLFFPLPRWTVKAKAFKSIIDNYPLLLQTFEDDLEDSVMPTEMRARINGIISIMYKFDYYFGFELGHFVLKNTDNLVLDKTMV